MSKSHQTQAASAAGLKLVLYPPLRLFAAGGASRDRTDDPLLAKQVLSQLSYGPLSAEAKMVGLGRFELPTSRLSGVRSNHLSYRPETRATNPCPGLTGIRAGLHAFEPVPERGRIWKEKRRRRSVRQFCPSP